MVYSRLWTLLAIALFFCSFSRSAEKPQTVVFFWNGDEVSTILPNTTIKEVVLRYQKSGMRVVQAHGLPPLFFRQFVEADRQSHPDDYKDKQVTLVIHGHGARAFARVMANKKEPLVTQASLLNTAESPLETGELNMDRVKDEEIILAFVEGIGEKARAEAIASPCFFGQDCATVSLLDTPLATRVSRLIVPKRILGLPLSNLIPAPTGETVLARLSDILNSATHSR